MHGFHQRGHPLPSPPLVCQALLVIVQKVKWGDKTMAAINLLIQRETHLYVNHISAFTLVGEFFFLWADGAAVQGFFFLEQDIMRSGLTRRPQSLHYWQLRWAALWSLWSPVCELQKRNKGTMRTIQLYPKGTYQPQHEGTEPKTQTMIPKTLHRAMRISQLA